MRPKASAAWRYSLQSVGPLAGLRHYYRKGLYDQAIADYDEVIRLNPNASFIASAFNNRGGAYDSKGDYDRAIADFNEALRFDHNYAFAFNNRGLAYARKGDYDRAMADYNEAIRLNAKFALAFCNRGKTKLKINDASGNEDIAKARQLDPLDYCRSGPP